MLIHRIKRAFGAGASLSRRHSERCMGDYRRCLSSGLDSGQHPDAGDGDVDESGRHRKTAIVVGGRVAGLATAACLERIGMRVTLLMGDSQQGKEGRADPGIGIWPHGLRCLDKLGILERLEAEGRYMGEAGYKDTKGRWLARPSPLRELRRDDGPDLSVLFVRESKLLEVRANVAVLSLWAHYSNRSFRPLLGQRPKQLPSLYQHPCIAFVGSSCTFRLGARLPALRSRLSSNVQIIPAEASHISWADVSAPGRELGRRRDPAVVGVVARSGVSTDGHQLGRRRQRSGLVIDLKAVAGEAREVRKSLEGTGSGRFLTSPDLLVGADGTQSLVRRFLLSSDASQAEAKRRGYVVYRGVCNAGLKVTEHERRCGTTATDRVCVGMATGGGAGGWGSESFQTWGPGLRFASVPLAGNERMWFATTADGLPGSFDLGYAGDKHPGHPGTGHPGEHVRVPVKTTLLKLFGDWHAPIKSLLEATAEEDIIRDDARAMDLQSLRLAASVSSRVCDPVMRGMLPQEVSAEGYMGTVLVGDAAHTLDPVLAQGAGLALEDAFWLAHRVGECDHSLKEGLGRFEEERLQRVLLLSRLSDLSQLLGQLRPLQLTRLRNLLFRATPDGIKTRFFDGFTSAALANGTPGALRAGFSAVALQKEMRGYSVPDLRV